ncbi:GNAT family N-acetyltransferase [Duganella qianjiadongensis]|uniref:GNAT family N-acetyltransferase n=1 Tax=Duganella qianjiadongensis TaxID=2692176 RepID=A0ABW9VK00_9BURK|nr:GNAT family N-acetyltransferase [Duganella qianjiadongensis]MYM39753.1 GNAT family N-acetyltransferase [Duganella qianjiadongensis]
MPTSPYLFQRLDGHASDTALRHEWHQLAAASSSSEAIYQTPAFANFLASGASEGHSFYLYGAYQAATRQRLGLVPLMLTSTGSRWPHKGAQLIMLGSSPLLEPEPVLLDALHAFLYAEFPQIQALVYPALPASHAIWRHLQRSRQLLALPLHGWRNCHSLILPRSYADYLALLGSKRRYNLKRQQRQLAQAAGSELALQVIAELQDLPVLQQGLQACCPPERLRHLWSETEMQTLAQQGLLLCFRVDAGTRCCGVILGLQATTSYHLFNILPAPQWHALSAGTSILQMVMAYLADQTQLSKVEFGYGEPAQGYQSANQICQRSHVLLLRRTPAHHAYRLWHRLRTAIQQCLKRQVQAR